MHLMVDHETGVVRHPWHHRPGPAIVWRGDEGDLSADDVCLMICFIDSLLARYRDKEAPIDIDAEVTREAFQFFKAREMQAASEENGDSDRGRWWGEGGFNI
mmetsp:Transcript_51315/g.166389  ORF Transcript_51315/g.166389 Transcript_51315/m.166389 type:complete len:102 (-) Transcript_51315:96-401(-)